MPSHNNIVIPIKNTSPYPNPTYSTPGSAGLDLRAVIEQAITLKSLERVCVGTGIYIQLPLGYEAQVRPRSGLALKQGITVLNAPGTIDSDYRGEIGVILINLSSESVEIQPGERIAQLVIAPYIQIEWDPETEFQASQRNQQGFGSTGKD
jgi:dUTP pyrophosphatase